MANENNGSGASMALGMIFGAMAGVGAGILMAPRSGEDTRNQLRAQAMSKKEAARQKLMEKKDQTMDTVKETVDKSKDLIGKGSDNAHKMADDVSDKATDITAIVTEPTSSSRRRGPNS